MHDEFSKTGHHRIHRAIAMRLAGRALSEGSTATVQPFLAKASNRSGTLLLTALVAR